MKDPYIATRIFHKSDYFERLIRDLEKGTRKRKIKREEYDIVKAVARLPEYPTEENDLSKKDQIEARNLAIFILDSFSLGDLVYDSDEHTHFVRG